MNGNILLMFLEQEEKDARLFKLINDYLILQLRRNYQDLDSEEDEVDESEDVSEDEIEEETEYETEYETEDNDILSYAVSVKSFKDPWSAKEKELCPGIKGSKKDVEHDREDILNVGVGCDKGVQREKGIRVVQERSEMETILERTIYLISILEMTLSDGNPVAKRKEN
ncbi:hypothetical protein PHYBLDRAFT_66462 [Phycomyces blakesleeanus NRRL 1555(-)]|uniref:Uncharacterized protein n=1 Tax=Phycomyces blakesleeanus (strain ATCC 8743b / DSM 1359 / FGSC 10004 / NBRC 33097 / NRRL 1555) TaxID=763407 RepID=A0A167LX02_PHYB8|nr:hypothetical protein PHYBLDRAFT_66462 [Phycomyces blakesleeanus NRRL 1555(-)]OAD71258.1 hypothetical protein PHYBLDRAFT_66462 [Phycomyces blakesleeanus NRRL 1555(-)]|eukprot:XP_018289298.1 hypothetical protein PHYBLDRAFT_66462 [Phycomyces blakesleeanus NRRL 1555(-)]